jgi:hypothetical protein
MLYVFFSLFFNDFKDSGYVEQLVKLQINKVQHEVFPVTENV